MVDDFDKAKDMTGETDTDNMPQENMRVGIVGHGFVGGAVDYAFTHEEIEKFYVDPKYDTTIDDLVEFDPHFTFVCVPTPSIGDGLVDASAVEDAVLKLLEHTKGGVIIKSTITPDIVDRLYKSLWENDYKRVVVNPEFLTESNAKEQFVNAEYHILGGMPDACRAVAEIYSIYSLCMAEDFIFMSGAEAAFVKYGVNSFLATKVTFFNQLYDAITKFGSNYPTIVNAIGKDPRIGKGHTRVPGYDGKRGFGGACFPKDTLAFTKFDEDLTLIAECIKINNKYRKEYELDDREKSSNVDYGQTKKELEDKSD